MELASVPPESRVSAGHDCVGIPFRFGYEVGKKDKVPCCRTAGTSSSTKLNNFYFDKDHFTEIFWKKIVVEVTDLEVGSRGRREAVRAAPVLTQRTAPCVKRWSNKSMLCQLISTKPAILCRLTLPIFICQSFSIFRDNSHTHCLFILIKSEL